MIDVDRAQIDITDAFKRLRLPLRNLKDLPKEERTERAKILAKNLRNQAMQFQKEAAEVYSAVK